MSGLTDENRALGRAVMARKREDIRSRSEKMTMARETLLTPNRGDDELRNAQLVLAGTALAHPRLGCAEEREAELEAELEEVLATLGLLRRIP